MLTGSALAIAAAVLRPARAATADGISHSAESIHQEPLIGASRSRVYQALTEAKQFDRVIQLSGVMQSEAMAAMAKPTAISPRVGGSFALFGGYITGRHIELVPNELLVQAWRAGHWDKGVYSIAKFEFTEQGGSTMIKFDHTGFPPGEAEHLAAGWQAHYWDPLTKYLR